MKALLRFYDIGALVCFAAMMACILIEVVSRNLLHLPTTWAEEASRLMCVWSVFLGSASAWQRGAHIVINVVLDRLSGRSAALLHMVVDLLSLVFLMCVWVGTLYIMKISYPSKTTALEISISYFYLGLFLGITGMVIFQIENFLKTARSLVGRRPVGAEEI
ncbi:MAG TPA: TRAP transporter small permease [Chromatiaceae bacterium]|nr:TRAP transporter small permease [Chromatiaceae bacterium]